MGVEKSGANPLLRLQVGSLVRAATNPAAAKEASRLVAVTPGGYTTGNPPEQRPSSPRTGKIDKKKLEINIAELSMAQRRRKTCTQIEKWLGESRDTLAGSWQMN